MYLTGDREAELNYREGLKPCRRAAKIVFAFYSPCGILPSAMNLRWTQTFVVNSDGRPAYLSQMTDILPFEVHYDG
jgi:hypothetical protein